MALDFLGALGGVGKGVMIGADQMRRQEAHDATLAAQKEAKAYRDDMLQIQKDAAQRAGDVHGVRMDAAKRLQEEQERAKTNQTLYSRIQSEYGDRPEYEREQMYFDNALKMGILKPEELRASKTAYDGMVKKFGVEAFDEAVLNGNPAKLQKLFKDQGLGELAYDPQAGAFAVKTPQGSQVFKQRDLMQIHALNGVLERELGRQKAGLDAQKTRAEIGKINAEAGRASRQYQDEVVQNPDGSVTIVPGGGGRRGNGSGKAPADPNPIPEIKFSDIAHLAPKNEDGQPDQAAGMRLASLTQNITVANPAFRKTPIEAAELASRTLLPDSDPRKLRVQAVQDPATGRYREGIRTERGVVYVGAGKDGEIDPRRPDLLSADADKRTAESNEIQLQDEAWLRSFAERDPKTMELLGPFMNGTQRAQSDVSVPTEKLEQALTAPGVSEETRQKARLELFARQNPDLIKAVQSLSQRVNDNARTPAPKKAGKAVEAIEPSEAQIADAARRGVAAPADPVGELKSAWDRFTAWNREGAERSEREALEASAKNFRIRSGGVNIVQARYLANALAKNPALAETLGLTEKDINDIEVATGRAGILRSR